MDLSAIPVATYRIQFNLNFRFLDARDLIPYLHDLGITHLYASPRWKAGKGSLHGYDVADPQRINSELGTEEEFDDLVRRLKSYKMGMLLDIVPNHMAATSENPWWMDVLENGPDSKYASYFDINWHPAATKAVSLQENKVLLPVLGDVYGSVLEQQELSLKLDDNGFHVRYFDHRFPLNLCSYRLILERCLNILSKAEGLDNAVLEEFSNIQNAVKEITAGLNANPEAISRREQAAKRIKHQLWKFYQHAPAVKKSVDETLVYFNGLRGDARSFEPLNHLLAHQSYRLAYWKMAAEEINYRRFFDINDLVGVRVEDQKIFNDRHGSTIDLVTKGDVAGLRVDHIDGLYDPQQYLERLQAAGRADDGAQSSAGNYVIVEKILGRNELLPDKWPVAGTTGYDFLNAVNGVFIDPDGFNELEEIYREFTGCRVPFAKVCYECNKIVMAQLFAGEVYTLGHSLGKLAAQDWYARDLPLSELVRALIEVTACLPIYRTYILDRTVSSRDRSYIERSLDTARRRSSAAQISDAAFDFLRRVLFVNPPFYAESFRDEWLRFVMQWQQFSGPVMAKGLEDTACYVYNSLISVNEVGGDAVREEPPFDLEAFHAFNQERLARWPHTLNATSTHDTKRSEDVRARINVLSELHETWRLCLARWARWNRSKKKLLEGRLAPDSNEEILIYQTMLGAWPLDDSKNAEFIGRLLAFVQKALREAKVHTNWLDSNSEYEDAVEAFVKRIVDTSEKNRFLDGFLAFQKKIAFYGCLNVLAQTLLKIAAPGVADFYQGAELWDFSMADPDNRRPVDFQKRIRALDDLKSRESNDRETMLREITQNWQDGQIKLYVTRKALNFRNEQRKLFSAGDYIPLYANGKRRENVCAFARRKGNQWVITVAPRLLVKVVDPGQAPTGNEAWGSSKLVLPRQVPGKWRNEFTGEAIEARPSGREKSLPLAGVFRILPVALLSSVTSEK